MKAIVITEDKKLMPAQVPMPVPAQGEVRIKVAYAGVNRADLLQVAGTYPPPPGCPDWPGLEVSGYIDALGEGVTDYKVGDEVCALLGGGGYAEYVTTPVGCVMPLPKGVGLAEAAGLPEVFATSWLDLYCEGGLKPGETLLITGGTGGLAAAAITMAKAMGARVLTTVRSAAKAESIAHLGADRVIVTSETPLPEALKEEFEAGHGVDVAMDCVGGPNVGASMPYVNRGARWIMIATLGGNVTDIDLMNLYKKGARLIGSTLRSRAPEYKAEILKELTDKVWPLFESGRLPVPACRVLDMTEANEAHELLAAGKRTGKVVLRIG